MQMLTKAWTAGVLSALGDIMAQLFVENRSIGEVEIYRVFVFTLMVRKQGVLLWLHPEGIPAKSKLCTILHQDAAS